MRVEVCYKKIVEFDQLDVGDTFKFSNYFYMKVMSGKVGTIKIDAVLLETGELVMFSSKTSVEKFPLKVVVAE